MKKFLCLIVLMLAVVCMFTACKSPDDLPDDLFPTSVGLAYEVQDAKRKTCSVVGIGTCTDNDIRIGGYIDGYKIVSIEKEAFYNNTNITSVTIGKSVDFIEESAFLGCVNLTNVIIGDSMPVIKVGAFGGCLKLTSFVVDENNEWYSSINGNLYSKDGKVLYAYAAGKTDTNFVIPNSVTTIDAGAFYICFNLTSVTIPNSVTTIGDSAFYGCWELSNVTIPNSVTKIGDSAFMVCSKLTNITIPESVTEIGKHAFLACSNLTSVIFVNPNGWHKTYFRNLEPVTPVGGTGSSTSDEKYSGGVEISATDLSDPAIAAKYLREIPQEGFEDYYASYNILYRK